MTDHEKATSIRDRVRPLIEKHGWKDGDTTRYVENHSVSHGGIGKLAAG